MGAAGPPWFRRKIGYSRFVRSQQGVYYRACYMKYGMSSFSLLFSYSIDVPGFPSSVVLAQTPVPASLYLLGLNTSSVLFVTSFVLGLLSMIFLSLIWFGHIQQAFSLNFFSCRGYTPAFSVLVCRANALAFLYSFGLPTNFFQACFFGLPTFLYFFFCWPPNFFVLFSRSVVVKAVPGEGKEKGWNEGCLRRVKPRGLGHRTG